MVNILVVDDKPDILELIGHIISDEKHDAICARSVKEALLQLEQFAIDLVILDIWLEGHYMDGIGLLKVIKAKYPVVPVIMISGHASLEVAIQTVKLGAYDFIEKPFKSEKLLILIKRALETKALIEANSSLQKNAQQEVIGAELLGASKSIKFLRDHVKTVATCNSRIILEGEHGTGKSAVAKTIHSLSRRFDRPFITLRTYNKTQEEIHNELFGSRSSKSLLEQAQDGTLFIEELANIHPEIQVQIADVIQHSSFLKNGARVNLDVRFIAASTKNLKESVEAGTIHGTFYSRLNTVTLTIPPLRDRKQDIQPLSEYFIRHLGYEIHVNGCFISDEAYSMLLTFSWLGNIRQLKNTIEGLLILAQKLGVSEISPEMLPQEILCMTEHGGVDDIPAHFIDKQYKEAKMFFEAAYLRLQLMRFNGNVAKTAAFIGMDRTALHRKIKCLSLEKYLL